MQIFTFKWAKCRDGYRIEERADPSPIRQSKRASILEGIGGGTFIVPKSANWEIYRPLDVPAAYRAFANWNGSDEGLRKLADAYGSMFKHKATHELIDNVRAYASGLRRLVASIDRAQWQSIADGLDKAGQGKSGPRPGIGRLGVVFEVANNKPVFRLSPPTLLDALQAQALFDAAFGIEHKKCRNPECEQWFPTKGPDAYRSDAEYHSEACRRRHAYLSSKKERRS
jgi:hypothetical protein